MNKEEPRDKLITTKTKLSHTRLPLRVARSLEKVGVYNVADLLKLYNECDYSEFSDKLTSNKGIGPNIVRCIRNWIYEIIVDRYR